MDWFSSIRVSLSGLDASRMRLDAATQNLANMDNSAPTDASCYRAKHVQISEAGELAGVTSQLVDSGSAPRLEYLPGHPDADGSGMVRFPDIDMVSEITDSLAAKRAYEIGLATLNEGRHLFNKTLEIGRE